MRAIIGALVFLTAACASGGRPSIELDSEKDASAAFPPRRSGPRSARTPPAQSRQAKPAAQGAAAPVSGIAPAAGKAPPVRTELPTALGEADIAKAGASPESSSTRPSVAGKKRGGGRISTPVPATLAIPPDGAASSPPPASAAPGTADAASLFLDTGRAAPAAAAQPPLMSGLNKDEIGKLLKTRLDIGAFRIQLSETRGFEDVVFDRTYDALKDINLYDEFRVAGIISARDAYWVRVAFIDLIDVETPFSEPRLYGLDKKRRAK